MIIVLMVAALIRLALLAAVSHHLDRVVRPDTAGYQYVAGHLWSDMWSRNPTDLYYTLLRTPGYPLMLAALGQQTLWVLLAQIAMSLVLVAVVYRLGLESIGEEGAIIAAAIVAFEPVGLTYDLFLLSEVPFALVFTVGILWWLRGLRQRSIGPILNAANARQSLGPILNAAYARQSSRWLAFAGVALGLATLIRPVSLYLLVVLVPITAIKMRRHAPVIACLVLAVAFALPIGAWLVRNLALTGHPVVSTIQGYDLAYYRGAYAIAAQDHVTLDQATQSVLAGVTASDSDPVAKADQLSSAGVAALLSHPKGFVEETATGAAQLLLGPGRAEWKILFGIQSRATDAFGYAISVALLGLAVVGGVLALRARRWDLLSMAAVLAYIVAVSSGGESYSRMRMPIEPLLAVLAAQAVVTLRHGLMARRDRSRGGAEVQ